MRISGAFAIPFLFIFLFPAVGQQLNPGRPGTINYVEGQVSIEGHPVLANAIGRTELRAGQYLATGNGKAEILLTPGIFLRLASNSTVRMISPNISSTEVEISQGRANVEVDQIYKQNRILIDFENAQTQILQNGLYEFDAQNSSVRTFEGKALFFSSLHPQAGENPTEVKGGREFSLGASGAKPNKFNKKNIESTDELYRWSSLRSSYLGEENIEFAQSYAGSNYEPGWYWNSATYDYTWFPGDGFSWSPFGYYGFYSPYYLYGGGLIYGGHPYRGGHYPGRPWPGHGGTAGGAFRGGGGISHGGGAVSHGGGGHR